MNESSEQVIDKKMDEFRKNLKIDINENDVQNSLIKELKRTNISYKIARVIGTIFFGGAAIMGLVALMADGGTVFGILIKEQYLYIDSDNYDFHYFY